MQVSQKELLNAKFNLMSTHDLLLEEKEYEKMQEVEELVSKIDNRTFNDNDWTKIQEYVIAREMIRDRVVANCGQYCFTENDNSRF